jgi:glycosyltransferase involved in cell wall biosynthesis
MSRRILVEAHNLTLPTGTGIATYARVLGRTLRDLSYQTDVLVGTSRPISVKDPLQSEVSFFDVSPGAQPALLPRIIANTMAVAGSPFGVRPSSIQLSGAVVGTSAGPFAGFHRIHAMRDMTDVARVYFKLLGHPIRIAPEQAPHLFHATQPIPLRVRGCPNIYTIHDLVPLRLPYTTLDDKKFFLKMVREIARRADHIVTVSEFSRRDIIELLGVPEHRVTNTYQSVHLPETILSRSIDTIATELANTFQLDLGEYYLFVGAIEPKKNISRLIDAFASAGSRRPLVVVGGAGWQADADLDKMSDERFLSYSFDGERILPRRRVRRLKYVPLAHLVALMRGARAVLFPSLYEGFGLPVLEAMLAGTPVLTSNVSSLPEVAGDAAVLVNPMDVDSIAAGIRALDHDHDLCVELIELGRAQAAKFSPERYRDRMAQLYDRILGHSVSPQAETRAATTQWASGVRGTT